MTQWGDDDSQSAFLPRLAHDVQESEQVLEHLILNCHHHCRNPPLTINTSLRLVCLHETLRYCEGSAKEGSATRSQDRTNGSSILNIATDLPHSIANVPSEATEIELILPARAKRPKDIRVPSPCPHLHRLAIASLAMANATRPEARR